VERRSIQLEKSWPDQPVAAEAVSLGSVGVRVVVFEAKQNEESRKVAAMITEGEEDAFPDDARGPLESYLERPGGKGYVVFWFTASDTMVSTKRLLETSSDSSISANAPWSWSM